MIDFNKLCIHTDGASRGNPGPGAIAVVICDENGNIIKEHSEYIGHTTNNQAEYRALIKALEMTDGITKEIILFSDSDNTVKQLKGINKVRDEKLKPLFEKVKEKERLFEKVTYTHVRRGNNKRADKLVNECLDKKLKS
jgi:ribonuclease HI